MTPAGGGISISRMTGNLRRSALVVGLAIVMLVAAGAGDAGPRSPKAKAAIKKYDRAVEQARAEYERAVAAAGKRCGPSSTRP